MPHDPSPDDTLLARIAAGEQGALSQLIARHGRGLRVFATRYLGNAADADDVVQDVFVSVWRHAGRFDPQRARASTWLYKITAHRCIDQRRRQTFRSVVGLEDIEDDLASDAPGAETTMQARQELSLARAGIARLPERQRMALLLKVVADLDVAAIGQVIGASTGSAEQLLVRARRALRDHMTAADDGRERTRS
ncbi:sigma-70 family RNA polymerase sigma factor [Aquabacter sp. CN5-332]|uniref:RNA polymerase sigma factor n=1 Tax=Aquabacter sp. CN5-332 TaxID=3156608 RepID=UPI0032B4E60A